MSPLGELVELEEKTKAARTTLSRVDFLMREVDAYFEGTTTEVRLDRADGTRRTGRETAPTG